MKSILRNPAHLRPLALAAAFVAPALFAEEAGAGSAGMPASAASAFASPFVLAPASASASTSALTPVRLGSIFFDWGALVPTPAPSGWRCVVFDAATRTFDRLALQVDTLRPGAALPSERRANERIIVVKDGILAWRLDGKTRRITGGSLLFLSPGANFGLTNVGDRPAACYVVDVSTGATGSFPGGVAAPSAGERRLGSALFVPAQLPSKATATGSACWFVDSPTRTFRRLICHTTTLNPGAATAVGTDEADELVFVESGVTETTLNGVSCRLGPGSFFLQASKNLHGTRNAGSVPATYLVIKIVSEKTPKP